MNPMGISKRQFGFRWVRSPRIAIMKPMAKQPEQFMTKVPYGKRVPMRSYTYPPNQNRATAPRNPPNPTMMYLIIRVQSSCAACARAVPLTIAGRESHEPRIFELQEIQAGDAG